METHPSILYWAIYGGYPYFGVFSFSTLTTRQLMVGFYLTNILSLSAKEEITQILVFTKIELMTSALAGVRGFLLDRSGDEDTKTRY